MTKGRAATAEPTRPTRSTRASALPPDARRSMIVAATLPLLLANGEMVSTRQIAEAAGIAEGTIFRVFADKDELISAVIETALDPEPFEQAVAAIDPALPFIEQVSAASGIIGQRVVDIWRLLSSVGTRFHEHARRRPPDSDALVALFARHQDQLSVEPATAAWLLRALALSASHPMLIGEPMASDAVVQLFLHGACRPC